MAVPSELLYPPLAVITPQDQRGVLWTVGIICLAFIFFTFALRVFVRWRRFRPDDYAILSACILVVAEAALSFAAVGLGLGSAGINQNEIDAAWRLFIASEAFFVLATFVAKAAVLLTFEKLLAPDMRERPLFQVTIGLVALLGLASLLVVTVNCSGRTCDHQSRWTAVAVMDSISELWGFLLFCWVVVRLQMRITFKLTAIAIIALRLFCIAFAGVHAYYVSVFQQGTDLSVDVIRPLAWQQLALAWALLSAMAVALRPFIRELHTGFGMDVAHVSENRYGKGSPEATRDGYQLQDLSTPSNRSNRQSSVPNRDDGGESGRTEERYRTDDAQYAAKIYHEDRTGSVDSMLDPIIRREVEYTVTYQSSRANTP
ncbi:Proline iminopeptidase [Lecanosticta acicola]|uniref:Proline iminopeptidase n=1 Tax=Lecanosticta acicola TaxID=111012 RepID=A0AAI8W2I9_9PEZI|nr:Proline iminopeptidase [Lecanosticta acicola]